MGNASIALKDVFSSSMIAEKLRDAHLTKTTTGSCLLDVHHKAKTFLSPHLTAFNLVESDDYVMQTYQFNISDTDTVLKIRTDSPTFMGKSTIRSPSTIVAYNRMVSNLSDELAGDFDASHTGPKRLMDFMASVFASCSESCVYNCEYGQGLWEFKMIDRSSCTSMELSICL
jgi:hypothetical protein